MECLRRNGMYTGSRLLFGMTSQQQEQSAAFISMALLAVMRSTFVMLLAAVFMSGGYGVMCSVCQSTAILLAGSGKCGLANSTYYIGLDLGMALGPILGGVLDQPQKS